MSYFCCCLDRDILPVLHLFNFTYIFRFFEFFQSGFQGSVFVCENCIIFSLFGHGVRVNNILLTFQYIYISHVERLQWLCDILRTPFLQNIFGRLLPRITILLFPYLLSWKLLFSNCFHITFSIRCYKSIFCPS